MDIVPVYSCVMHLRMAHNKDFSGEEAMGVRVEKGFFHGLADVIGDVKQNGTWPTTYVAGTTTAAEIHWHSEDVNVYVMEGQTDFLDAESGKRHQVMAGDKITVPARTLHAEGAVEGRIVYIIAVPEALAPGDFLKMRPAEEL